jgi:nitroimidazol reductase NimA-like FMN-containing flavoprotein (pyridoxamine 5'-phosphate oxidase superfamily)
MPHRPGAAAVLIDGGLELLTEAQARTLLAGGEIGRIGVTIAALPAIFPVNYRVIDGAIVFRTAAGSKLSAATSGCVVAFEVDDYQLSDRSGWSVLVVGRAEVVDDERLADRARTARLEPLADGLRHAFVRIEPSMISGRRLVHGIEGPPPGQG